MRPSTSAVTPDASRQLETGWSDKDSRLVWDSVTRPLLRLGTGGPKPSHSNTLRELLAAHKLVKVQLNGDPAKLMAAAMTVSAGAGAALVEQKGRTLLFATEGAEPSALLAYAEQSAVKIQRYHEKAKARSEAEREVRDAQRDVRDFKAAQKSMLRKPSGIRPAGQQAEEDDESDDEQAGGGGDEGGVSAARQLLTSARKVVPRGAATASGASRAAADKGVRSGSAGGSGSSTRTARPPAKRASRAPWRQALQEKQDELQAK